MQIELTGRIVNVLPTQRGQGKNGEWVKNSFVIEWKDNGYTKHLCLEVVGEDKFEKIKNAVKVGYEVLCRFSVSSREYQGRWFTSTNCFYCANVGGQQQTQTQQTTQAPQAQGQQKENDDDLLPF